MAKSVREYELEDMLEKVLQIGISFSGEKHRSGLLEKILAAFMELAVCDLGVLYSLQGQTLRPELLIIKSEHIHEGRREDAGLLPSLPLEDAHICAKAVRERRIINVADAASCADDKTALWDGGRCRGYRVKSMFAAPVRDDEGQIMGAVCLGNALAGDGTVIAFHTFYEQILSAVASQAAVCLQNVDYAATIQKFLDSFVHVMSTAIDARTPYNDGHTRNMAAYGERFIDWLDASGQEWRFSEEKKRIFLLSIWLHDIGKLVTPRSIMNKCDRLGNNLPYIEARFQKIGLLTKIEHLEGRLDDRAAFDALDKLKGAWELILAANKISVLPEDMAAQIERLAGETYTDVDGTCCRWLTEQECAQLKICKGTLTEEEREVMRNHVVMTQKMLEQMVFEGGYENILQWASQHHELLDGSGYPRGLRADQIAKEVRLLTILDIFEALTADDRPYKPPMSVERSLDILYDMADKCKIDREILDLFVQSRAWEPGAEA